MPAFRGRTEHLERISVLLQVLTAEWQERDALIERVTLYPPEMESARRMLRADLDALRALGFQIERSEGRTDPFYRLTGHERYGREMPVRHCPRCAQWRPLTSFDRDSRRSSGHGVYCCYCNQELTAQWRREHPEFFREANRRWQRKFRARIGRK